jgi:aspartate kinase
MIIQNEPESEGATADMSFTVPRSRLRDARGRSTGRLRASDRAVAEDPTMGKVSVVGAGMKSHPGVAAQGLRDARRRGINIEMISTSPIKISCVVQRRPRAAAVRALHEAFELGADDVAPSTPSRAA